MESITDFEVWLSENEPENHEEIYALYMAVSERENYGFYEVSTKGDKTFVKGPSSNLALLSEKARATFIRKVDELKEDDELDMESWYGFRRNMSNPKA